MNLFDDNRIVLTLDAGGTNFYFSAIRGMKFIAKPVGKSSEANNLDKCLSNIIKGFVEIIKDVKEKPTAISFAFPGPADYKNGIIGDLGNLPCFRGGVALGPMLQEHFQVPVFINNDGDLFAYGEAKVGILPLINAALKNSGSPKQYANLIGLTIGTGFGAGLVCNGQLIHGDNSSAGEIWINSSRYMPDTNIEEGVSARAIVHAYSRLSNTNNSNLTPLDIFSIANDEKQGDIDAAIKSFELFGKHLGDAIANMIALFDGIVVIGGGLSASKKFYIPSLIQELKGNFKNSKSETISRIVQKIYNFDDKNDCEAFLQNSSKQVIIPNSNKTVTYDYNKKTAVAHSKLGASRIISLGAYVFALENM